jgi:hypothetical protein
MRGPAGRAARGADVTRRRQILAQALLSRRGPAPPPAAARRAAAAPRVLRRLAPACAAAPELPAQPPKQQPAPPDVAPELLLALQQQERLASGAGASTSGGGGEGGGGGSGGAIVPRTRARVARAAGAPGYRFPQAAPGGGAPPASALAALLGSLGVAAAPGAAAEPWAQAVCAQVEDAAAAGRSCAAAPDPPAALAAWLGERGAAHWLPLVAAVDAAGGLGGLPVDALEGLVHAAAACAGAPVDSNTTEAAEAAAPPPALALARAAFVERVCEAMLQQLAPAADGSGSQGSGDATSGANGAGQTAAAPPPLPIERAAALLRSLALLRARPPQLLLQALLAPLAGALHGAPPGLLAGLACDAATAGALLRASWLAALRDAALAAAEGADGAAAVGLLWALARYQQFPPAPGAYAPLLDGALRGAADLAPADATRALTAVNALGADPGGSWAVALLDASAGRLPEAADLFELAQLARAGGAAAAPSRPRTEWSDALRGAALAVAARRAGVVPGGGGGGGGGSGDGAEDGQEGAALADGAPLATDGAGAPGASLCADEVAALLQAMVRYRWLRPRGTFLSQLLQLYARWARGRCGRRQGRQLTARPMRPPCTRPKLHSPKCADDAHARPPPRPQVPPGARRAAATATAAATAAARPRRVGRRQPRAALGARSRAARRGRSARRERAGARRRRGGRGRAAVPGV